MGCMSGFCVLVVVLAVPVTGGILNLIWVLLLCFMLTGNQLMIFIFFWVLVVNLMSVMVVFWIGFGIYLIGL